MGSRGYSTHAQRSLARDCAALRAAHRRHARESMLPADVESAVRRLIRGRFERDGEEAVISMDIFRDANLPMQLVTQPLVRRLIKAVRDDMQMEKA